MAGRSRGELSLLGPILGRLVGNLGLRMRLQQEAALIHWAGVVGPQLARHTRALEIKRGVLHVQVRNSAWANQLAYLETDILARLNAAIGSQAVKDIRWVVGSWHDNEADAPPKTHPGTVATVVLGEEDRREIARLAALIPDEELRRVWERFLAGEFRRRAWRMVHGWPTCPICGTPHPRGALLCPACRYGVRGRRAALRYAMGESASPGAKG